MKLQSKLIFIICSLILFVILFLELLFQHMLSVALKEQIGLRALSVAEAVASSPTIKHAFKETKPSNMIQPYAEKVRQRTGAEFVVVGNTEGIRYSHPIPERIGKKMVGGDNGAALSGKAIVSEAVGSLGPSIRGKAPIFDDAGNVIGIVSVGFLIEDVHALTWSYQLKVLMTGIIALTLGVIGSIVIARGVKKAIHGLEPKQIGLLYQEKQAILEAIREGIVAINADGVITMANPTAMSILNVPEKDIVGKHILDIVPNSRLLEIIKTGKVEYDDEMLVGEQIVITNRIPIVDNSGAVIGAVSTFRNKSEFYQLTQELAQVKSYAEALRAQTHEFSNKLYLISGLIQLEQYDDALELITKESNIQQNLIRFIMNEIPDPIIGGLLIGKFNQANELKIEFDINRESSFKDVPEKINRDSLVTIIGNIIDNAMESVLQNHQKDRKVTVFLTDLGKDLIIEVEDTGVGISEEIREKIFERGFSTKAATGRGYGLDLVKKALGTLNGYLTFDTRPEGGAIFTIVIPKY
ncbi:sensor histidine kinase [Anoxybacillus sp. FSL W8-1294]|uniref:sensor histidine kinase n=1 Tax=Anoxybacillus sp. FSL W8-1294 TaxID=2954655 RepID=UPI0030D54D3B